MEGVRAKGLFDRLPDRLFSPLAGPNRRIYSALLLDLYPLFFEQVHMHVFPSRETVRRELDERLRLLTVEWQTEVDEESVEVHGEDDIAARAYYRLRQAGWFEEEKDGYKTSITIRPAVGAMWTVLMEIARPESVFYGGMILSIYNNINVALTYPEEQALAFRQAARDARLFLQHLNTMIYGLKGILGDLKALDDHRQILGRFFDDFVERFLVQDYKQLKTRNNPFRYRQQILQMILTLDFNTELKQQLVAGIQAQTGESNSEKARHDIESDIDKLRAIFEQIDHHLARIDRYRNRVEQRVADTIRYLDRSQPGMATRIAGLLKHLGSCKLLDDVDDEELCWFPLVDTIPISGASLRDRKQQRSPPEPRVLRIRYPDPAVMERQRALREYLQRRRIDPALMANYLEQQLGNELSLNGESLQISTVEDFMAFTHLRHLEHLPGMQKLRKQYRIERTGGWIDNQWLRCPSFIVHRQNKKDPHAA